jgi:transposase-like protein
MPEKRRQYEQEFKEGAVRIVRESGKSIAEIARDLDINAGTLGNWVARDRGERGGAQGLSTDDVAELKRLRSEIAQLRMERDVFAGCKTKRRLDIEVSRLGRATESKSGSIASVSG